MEKISEEKIDSKIPETLEEQEEVVLTQEEEMMEDIRKRVDTDPLEEFIDLGLVKTLPSETLSLPQNAETPEIKPLTFTKYTLVKNKNPDSHTIIKTSHIHLMTVLRSSDGKLYREQGVQPNQKIKYKLLGKKFKNLYEFFKVTIFSMKAEETAFIQVPKEIHMIETFDDDIFYRVEIPYEKVTKGIAGKGSNNANPAGGSTVDLEEIKKIIDGAEDLKNLGNEHYRKKEYDIALEKWLRGKDDLRCLPKKNINALDDEYKQKLDKVKIDIINNIFVIYKIKKEFGLAERLFLDSKKFAKNNIKFFRRYAAILVLKGDQDEEALSLEEVFRENTTLEKDEAFEELVQEFLDYVNGLIKDEKEKVRKSRTKGFQNFFGGINQDMEIEEKIRLRQLKEEDSDF